MKHLLYKECRLAVHPTSILFLGLSALLLIPNYPYYFTFFYTALGVFFTCLSGRENHDIEYTAALPVRKKDIVRARFAFVILIELTQMAVAVPFALLRGTFDLPGNQVGIEANLAFFGLALAMLGVFNLVFLTRYYANPDRVGAAFVWGSTVTVVYILLAEASVYVIPFMRDRMDTKDPAFLGEKLFVLAIGAALFALLNYTAYRKAERSFTALDL